MKSLAVRLGRPDVEAQVDGLVLSVGLDFEAGVQEDIKHGVVLRQGVRQERRDALAGGQDQLVEEE